VNDKWANAPLILRKKNRKGWHGNMRYAEWTEWQVWRGKLVIGRFADRAEAEAFMAGKFVMSET
jgi:hypothetical protein